MSLTAGGIVRVAGGAPQANAAAGAGSWMRRGAAGCVDGPAHHESRRPQVRASRWSASAAAAFRARRGAGLAPAGRGRNAQRADRGASAAAAAKIAAGAGAGGPSPKPAPKPGPRAGAQASPAAAAEPPQAQQQETVAPEPPKRTPGAGACREGQSVRGVRPGPGAAARGADETAGRRNAVAAGAGTVHRERVSLSWPGGLLGGARRRRIRRRHGGDGLADPGRPLPVSPLPADHGAGGAVQARDLELQQRRSHHRQRLRSAQLQAGPRTANSRRPSSSTGSGGA
ncbi:MAG: hypothetical protein MZW92_37965 [Comamonadaceae bacterium]|nr:hypothetical protein [Comamonadaceae bacterium]